MNKAELKVLIKSWFEESKHLLEKSNENYQKLRAGDLPQDDEIIYSVYEDYAQAITLRNCAAELEKLL